MTAELVTRLASGRKQKRPTDGRTTAGVWVAVDSLPHADSQGVHHEAIASHLDSKSLTHHDAPVRTTVTLEPDVAARLKDLAHRRRASFKETLNDVLRKGLSSQAGTREPGERYVVEPHAGGFRPGIDPAKLNQLVDELDVADFVGAARLDE